MDSICLWCGKELTDTRYGSYCDRSCHAKHSWQKGKEKRIKTNLEKYGVENPFQAEEIKKKARETMTEKYGAPYSTQSGELLEKIKASTLKNNGVVCALQLPKAREALKIASRKEETIEKRKKTSLKLYGVTCSLQAPEQLEKTKQQNLSKYGVEHTLQRPDVIEKRKCTNLSKYGSVSTLQSRESMERTREALLSTYGVDHPMRSEVLQKKRKKTCLKKYGVESPMQADEVKQKAAQTCLEKYGVSTYLLTDDCMLRAAEAGSHTISNINKQWQSLLPESEFEYRIGNRSYDLRLGNVLIEIDPAYTHNSTIGPSFNGCIQPPLAPTYHKEKTLLAERNGFRCVHIYDWDDKDKIVRLLAGDKKTIYARNTVIKEVSQKDTDEFLRANHLQNTCRGQIVRLGLYTKDTDELVQLMTFGKSRYNKKYQWELLRLCSTAKVVGGAEKLFKRFIILQQPKSIISYCDRNKFTGDVYKRLGMQELSSLMPGKQWYNGKRHFTDSMLAMHGADRLIGTSFGKGTSNNQIMLDNGFVEIYDAGQQAYIIQY